MGLADQFLGVIEKVHAASLDPGRWPAALQALGEFSGSRASTLETLGVADWRHRALHSWNMRPATQSEYLTYHPGVNSRVRYCMGNPHVPVCHDGDLFREESEIDSEPFYAEFLIHHDVRYFAAAPVRTDGPTRTFVSLLRAPRQGPSPAVAIDSLARIAPHIRLAVDVGARIDGAVARAGSALAALEWLGDGAALLAADGRVVHANARLAEMARLADGLSLRDGRLQFADGAGRRAFEAALSRVLTLVGGEVGPPPGDFALARPSGLPPLVVAMRPLFRSERELAGDAAAVIFVRDPCAATAEVSAPAGEVFGLTPAEAALAAALCAGLSPVDYARDRGVSVNTVYTHLKRLKEKVGVRRLTGLVQRLKDAAPR